ncbi:hypothetical protein C8J57DRAFT_1503579 [Mycena rebaudengoi]|nr:hypothetical protein C8J57DRAFT_1503579 [Mycena rebaudengoi]
MFSLSSPSFSILTSSSHPYLSRCSLVLVTIPYFSTRATSSLTAASSIIRRHHLRGHMELRKNMERIVELLARMAAAVDLLADFLTLTSTQLGIPPARCPCSVRANFYSNNTSTPRRPARRTIQHPELQYDIPSTLDFGRRFPPAGILRPRFKIASANLE